MNTLIYLESIIERFFKTFAEVQRILYQFDKLSNTHLFLITKDIYDRLEFADFDFTITNEAFEHNIQGQICFTTDALIVSEPKVYFNRFNNDVLLSNLNHFIDIRSVRIDLNSFERSFSVKMSEKTVAYESFDNLALAA